MLQPIHKHLHDLLLWSDRGSEVVQSKVMWIMMLLELWLGLIDGDDRGVVVMMRLRRPVHDDRARVRGVGVRGRPRRRGRSAGHPPEPISVAQGAYGRCVGAKADAEFSVELVR